MDRSYFGVCLLAAVAYYNTWDAGFVYDDNRAILTNPDVVSTTNLRSLLHNDFWGSPLSSTNSHGSYRPITVATFRFNFWMFGLNPTGYHLTNIVFHCIATGLVLYTGRVVIRGRSQTLAALIFAVHPVHTEAVAGVVGRADLLACIFYLLSFNVYVSHLQIRQQRIQHKYSETFTQHKLKDVKLNFTSKQYRIQRFLIYRKMSFICTKMKQSNLQKYSDESVHFTKQYMLLLLSVLLAFCATMCKETGITVLLISAIYDILLQLRQNHTNRTFPNTVSLIILVSSFTSLLYLRLYLMDNGIPNFSKSDNPTAHSSSFITRTLTFLYLPVVNLQILIYPRWLSFDWSMDAIQRITTIWDYRNCLSLSLYCIIYYLIKSAVTKVNQRKYNSDCKVCFNNEELYPKYRLSINNNLIQNCDKVTSVYLTKHQSVLMCLAFLVIPFVPASNLPFYVGFVIAERVLYIPSIGFCFFVGFGCRILSKRVQTKLVSIVFTGFLFVLMLRTLQRNKDWRDEENLYRSGVKINPPKAYGNLGSILSTQGRLQEAENAFRLALLYRPNMADVHYNLGNLERVLKKYTEAISSYEMAIKLRPSLAVAHLNLGVLLASLGHCERAEQVLRRCSQLEGTGLKDIRLHNKAKVNALINLGKIYYQREKLKEAVNVYLEGISMVEDQYQQQVLKHLHEKSLYRIQMKKPVLLQDD